MKANYCHLAARFEAAKNEWFMTNPPQPFGYTFTPEQLEQYTADVIRDVCRLVNQHMQNNNPNDCLLVLGIKEHFGIEE